MSKIAKLSFLALPLLLCGCSGSADDSVVETKPSDVKVNLTDEQKADVAAKFKDPNFAKNMKN